MKTVKIFLVIFVTVSLLLSVFPRKVSSTEGIDIEIENKLDCPVYKAVNFSLEIAEGDKNTNFTLQDGNTLLPLEVNREGSRFNFRSIINFAPKEKKTLTLKYGGVQEQTYNKILMPDFSGNSFLGIGSGKLCIVSLEENNSVKIIDQNKENMFEGVLQKKETKIISLKESTVFKISSSYPIFAFVSSLDSNPEKTSSDDFSSVYGTYFILYVPKQIFVSTIEENKIEISELNGEVVFKGDLPEKGVYDNLNLKEGFYEIISEKPVNISFGYIDDNVYGFFYGGVDAFKGVSFGNIICSSLFPGTQLTIKTLNNSKDVTLDNPGDFSEFNLINSFAENSTEFAPVYITYNKPVLIYSDSNFGNLGGEQIPSFNQSSFLFLTGKVVDLGELKRDTGVIVIANENSTEVTVNGTEYTLSELESKEFRFKDSHSLVNITANRPIVVFEVGFSTSKEFFSTLLPLADNSLNYNILVGKAQNNPNPGSKGNNLLKSIGAFFIGIWESVKTFFTGLFDKFATGNFFNDLKDSFATFFSNAADFFKKLSQRIIILFYPVSDYIYPYISKYFPGLSREELSAYIFFALIAILLLIILIPKRRKTAIPTLSMEEVKKHSLSFNVKTVEEKSNLAVQETEEIKPTTIKMKREETLSSEVITEEAGEKQLLSEETEVSQVKEKPLQRRPFFPSFRAVPKSKTLGEKEQILEKAKPIKELKIREPKEESATPAVESVQGIVVIQPKEVEKKEEPEIQEIVEKVRETTIKPPEEAREVVSELEEIIKEGPSFADFAQPKLEEMAKAEAGEAEKKEEIVAQTKETEESKTEQIKTEEKPEAHETEQAKPEEIKPESKEIKEQQPSIDFISQLEEKVEKVPEVSEEEPSTIEILLKKIEEQEKLPGKISETVTSQKEVLPEKKVLKKSFDAGVVLDADSLNKLLECLDDNQKRSILSGKAFISAKDKAKIRLEIDSSYKIGIIALTPIEERIADDISKRVGSSISTAEAILIAKKIRLNDVLINDSPKLLNYQGIVINKVEEIIS